MLSGYFISFFVFWVLFILSHRCRPDCLLPVHRLLQPFLRIVVFLWDCREWIKKHIPGFKGHRKYQTKDDNNVIEDLKLLYPDNQAGTVRRKRFYYQQKCAVGLAVLFAGNLLALAASIAAQAGKSAESVDALLRNGYGKGPREVLMEVAVEGSEFDETLSVTVEARAYTQKEAYDWIDRAIDALPEAILAENADMDHVEEDLKLITALADNPCRIKWESGDYQLMDASGHITADELPEEGVLCLLTAQVSCQEYSKEIQMYVRILPGEISDLERLRQDLAKALAGAQEESRTQERFHLPEEIDGQAVIWTEHKEDTGVIIMALAGLLAVGIFMAMDRDLHKKAEAYKERMAREYPELVSKLVLFLGAGMTIRGAFHRLAAGQEIRSLPGGGKNTAGERIVYTEIARACYEMDSGISESQAYLNLGKRCQDQHYVRLSMLLVQNLTKGTAGLSELLEREAGEAFAERKRSARKYGEEAGTKLLFPMMILLLIVMIVIMVPAFLSFSG